MSMSTNSAAANMLFMSQQAAQSSGQHRHKGERAPSSGGLDAQESNTASPSGSAGKVGSSINITV